MVVALTTNANVMMAGMESCVMQNFVTHVATTTDNAKTELVFVSLDGMENTAHLKAVPEGKVCLELCLPGYSKIIFNSCSSHGQCRVGAEGLFECRCNDGWDGIDCSLPLEKDCKDGKDNDKGKNKDV